MTASLNARNVFVALVVAGLLLLPLYTSLSGNIFALTLFTRIVIYALAAASLNLIMGYGGMMSSHAAISASAATRSAFSPMKASAPASSSGRWRWRHRRSSRW
jgi:ABC-type branched-subunit amino acid transport system permease subunit